MTGVLARHALALCNDGRGRPSSIILIQKRLRTCERYNRPMKNARTRSLAIVLCVFSSLSIAAAAKTMVELKDASGKSVGTAVLSSKGASSGVSMKLNLNSLPPGQHALHFHQKAQCDAPDFKSAGPHFNPESKKHGLENPEGHHAGDMNNFTVDANGKAKFKVVNKDVTLGDDSHSLFSNGGTALVIHAKADDMKTDPAGNAGDRIACGVITK
jgi:superoxide dismutase, Cu-Zn family